jgi:hypothetical protein
MMFWLWGWSLEYEQFTKPDESRAFHRILDYGCSHRCDFTGDVKMVEWVLYLWAWLIVIVHLC